MIVVDVETTGLLPKRNSIVSVGAVEFENPKNQFYGECRMWEGAEINPKALEINGFTYEQITDPNKRSLEDLMKSFVEWMFEIDDITFAGTNPSFDVGFLSDSTARYNLLHKLSEREGSIYGRTFGKRTIDLHTAVYLHYKSRGEIPPLKNRRTNINSDTALTYAGLPKEPQPHNGLTGAKMMAEAFSRIIMGKNLLPEFSPYLIPDYLLK